MRQGVELRRSGRDDEALRLFRQAHELAPGPRTLAQMGLAEQALGRWLEAEQHVRESLDHGNDAWIGRNRAALEGALETIRAHVGRLAVTGAVPGAHVLVDGAERGIAPMAGPIVVASGRVTVELRHDGYYEMRRDVQITAGQTARLDVEMRPLARGARGETRGDSRGDGASVRTVQTLRTTVIVSRGSPAVVVGAVLIGTGLLTLAGGIGANVLRENSVTAYNQDTTCPGLRERMQPSPCLERIDAAGLGTGFMIAGYVSAGVLSGLGIALVAAGATAAPTETTRVSARFQVGPDRAAVSFAFGF